SLPDDYRATPEVTSSPDVEAPASTPASQTTSSDGVVSDRASVPQDTSTAAPTSEPTDEFEQLQEQLRVAQQQLQDAKAQLQAAKEHEAQIQTIRERERQLQVARQQLQEVQAQLQATLAELHETQQRISQY
ncbi:MAG: hypothetical protein JO215_07275, partial [Ktedonobacteraceae bacterium]|nr:hypothetical protein [Ktedonobacteraceae bacterium]